MSEAVLTELVAALQETKQQPPDPPRPGRPHRQSSKSSTRCADSPNTLRLEKVSLDPFTQGLLSWVANGCSSDEWDDLSARKDDPKAPPWLDGDALGLDRLSHQILGLAMAHSVHLHGSDDEGSPFPTRDEIDCGSLLQRLRVAPPAGIYQVAKLLAEDAPLRQQGLIEVTERWSRHQKGGEKGVSIAGFMRTRLSLNVHALGGLLGIPEPVEVSQGPTLEELALPPEVRTTLERLLERPPAPNRPHRVLLKGPAGFGRRTVAQVIADRLGLPLKQVRPYDLPQGGSCVLLGVESNFDADDWKLVQGHKGWAFLRIGPTCEPSWDVEACSDLVIDLSALDVASMIMFAARQLREAGDLFGQCDPVEIAQGGISPGKLLTEIRRLKQEAEWQGHDPETVKNLLMKAVVRTQKGRGQDKFIEAVQPKRTLAELSLDPKPMERFRQIIRAIKGRKELLSTWKLDPGLVGRAQGILLFHGPSGTGKSMAAEVLAHELQLPLHRIEASELETPYVGESESRLHRFFQGAKGKPSVLLLDEADSVLGDRSSASGSSRRYQTSLTNAWLRELDQFQGILVFTTNHAEGFDPAMERRIQFRLEFPAPNEATRLKIWDGLFAQAPVPGREDLDLTTVADQFPLSGGRIRNAFLDALQRTAELGAISQSILQEACEEEYRSSLPRFGQGNRQIRGFAPTGVAL